MVAVVFVVFAVMAKCVRMGSAPPQVARERRIVRLARRVILQLDNVFVRPIATERSAVAIIVVAYAVSAARVPNAQAVSVCRLLLLA